MNIQKACAPLGAEKNQGALDQVLPLRIFPSLIFSIVQALTNPFDFPSSKNLFPHSSITGGYVSECHGSCFALFPTQLAKWSLKQFNLLSKLLLFLPNLTWNWITVLSFLPLCSWAKHVHFQILSCAIPSLRGMYSVSPRSAKTKRSPPPEIWLPGVDSKSRLSFNHVDLSGWNLGCYLSWTSTP